MALATIRLNILEALNVTTYEALQFTFNQMIGIDQVLDTGDFSISQVFYTSRWFDISLFQDLVGSCGADAVYIRQRNPNLLLVGDGNTGNSYCHELTLPLLMLRFKLIDNVHPAFTADNFVIGTDFLDTGTHFHADHLLSGG